MIVLPLRKNEARRLCIAMDDAIRDREEYIRCILEPFKFTKPDTTTKKQVREEQRQIAFCRTLSNKIRARQAGLP